MSVATGRVLVTGCAGRLGRFAVEALQQAGWRVTGVDKGTPANRPPDNMVTGDASDPDFLTDALRGHDALVHLAAIPDPFRDTAFVVLDTNLRLANAAVAAATAAGVRRLVFASSQTALGLSFAAAVRSPAYIPIDEAHPCAPEDTYSLSKLMTESLFAMAVRRDGAAATGLRFPVIWDEATFAENTGHRLGNPSQGAKSQWAYIDARDAGRAIVLALARQQGFDIFNIAADDIFAEEAAADLVRRWYTGLPAEAFSGLKDRDALFSSRKARQVLGFRNRYRWTAAGIVDRET